MPVHYSIPVYYVCQCLAEMVMLEIDTLIYVLYSKESTTFFKFEIWCGVVGWGFGRNYKHLRSATPCSASKIKTCCANSEVFTFKPQTCLKFTGFKNARLEIARVRGRGSEISASLSHSRYFALALSHSRASRFLKPVDFRHALGFHVKTSRFYF